ncbi:helix-turn-helix domain-containing protein [Brevibacillus sp. B_LB10_24]|uniref:helix-turn-helix domain-containing protein n=1 Tax=Brevibacillus sp. B_LB10_24 TaxID=3380645 RepID=UPI0038B85247
MSVIQMIECSFEEAYRLFHLIKKYRAKCSLELNVGESADQLIGIAQGEIDIDYLESTYGPETLIIILGEAEFSFDLESHSFAKYVTDCQIMVSIMKGDAEYVAFFNSSIIPSEGIEEANNCQSKNKPKSLKRKVIEAVQAAMKAKDVTKSDLSRLTGYSYQYIYDLLAGRRRWHEEPLERVCNVLGISIAFEIEEAEADRRVFLSGREVTGKCRN